MKIGFFVTCLVDTLRPEIAIASIKLLEDANCDVHVPSQQTCCAQIAFNNGDLETSKSIARNVINVFEPFDYLVAPSGSCLSMIKVHYPELFKDEAKMLERANNLSEKSYEILTFLNDILDIKIKKRFPATVTYHDSCSGLRELGIKSQPRKLLSQIKDLKITEMHEPEVCCGFGGTFCVKYPEISTNIVTEKSNDIKNTGADILVGGDLGCLLNISGRCSRMNIPIKCFHTVELLAGIDDCLPIGKTK